MKKLIALLLAAVMCLSLAACDNGKTENTDHSQGQNTENTSKENQQTETASQGNGNTEQLTDERYQEGTDPADIDKKYVGVRKRGGLSRAGSAHEAVYVSGPEGLADLAEDLSPVK